MTRRRIIIFGLWVCVCFYGYFAISSYYGRYYYVLARQGEKSQEEYERLLRRSLELDPTYGRANIEIARLLLAKKAYGAAHTYQLQGMENYRSVGTYEQLGVILEKLEESKAPGGSGGRLQQARGNYEKAARMSPGNVSALERLALLALKEGDSVRLEELSRDILRVDMDNLNVYYFRALDAERQGNLGVTLAFLQKLSAAGKAPEGSVFKIEDVRARLKELELKVRNQPAGVR